MRICARFVLTLILGTVVAGPLVTPPLEAVAAPGIATAPSHRSPVPDVLLWLLTFPAALGAIRVKDTGAIAKKFVRNAGAASGEYADNVKAAGADWEANTRNAGDNWAQGVNQAVADKRFERGVAEAGQAKFTTNASTKGAQRYGPGVQAAEADFVKGAGEYLDVIRNLTLPPRRPKGDPGNQARANAVAAALRAKKVGK